MINKVIPLGTVGNLVLAEEAGVVSLKLSLAESVGGGSVAGVVKAGLSAEVELSAAQLIDVGLELAKAKFPSVASLIDAAKLAIDAELAKA